MIPFPHHVAGAKCPGCDERLKEGHPDIQKFFYSMKAENNFIHCSWVHRDEASQEQAFNAGLSKLHFPHSAHNQLPARAVDIFHLNVMGAALFDPILCAKLNQSAIAAGFKMLWGGNFKTLGDSGHFELLEP